MLGAKEVVVVDSMFAGAIRFSVPEGSTVRAERTSDDGRVENQAFIYNVDAGYLVTTLQLKKWSSSKTFDIGEPAVRVFFRPAGSVGGRLFSDVTTKSFGATRAIIQTAESRPSPGVPAVPGRLFNGKPTQDGIPEFREARFSSRCLANFGDAVLLFNVCGCNAEQVQQLVDSICSSVSCLQKGIPTDSPLNSAPFSVTLEHAVVRFMPIGQFKINGSAPAPIGHRYRGSVLINSSDGNYTISMCESPVNPIDTGSDDEQRIKLCKEVFAASGGDNAHSQAVVFHATNKTVTCVRNTSSNNEKWRALCIVYEEGRKVLISLSTNDHPTMERLLMGILPPQ